MSHHHHQIDYIELPANQIESVKHFYSAAFDWRFTDYGPSYAGFRYADAEGEAGGISGAADRTPAVLAILYSEDLETTEQKVMAAGGKITKPIFLFPGGRRFQFADPGGNELAVWSEK